MAFKHVPEEFFRYVLVTIGSFISFFYISLQGQIFIDAYEKNFHAL